MSDRIAKNMFSIGEPEIRSSGKTEVKWVWDCVPSGWIRLKSVKMVRQKIGSPLENFFLGYGSGLCSPVNFFVKELLKDLAVSKICYTFVIQTNKEY